MISELAPIPSSPSLLLSSSSSLSVFLLLLAIVAVALLHKDLYGTLDVLFVWLGQLLQLRQNLHEESKIGGKIDVGLRLSRRW